MRIILFLSIFFWTSLQSLAQLQDNFSDGDLTNAPSWQGDLNNFIVNSDFELQLMAPEAGNSLLFVPTTLPDSAIWTLYFNMNFAPSGSNLLRIYLQADSDDLLNANGYYLEVGETGSEDALHFYRQDAGIPTYLTSATLGTLGSQPALARLKIERTAQGLWSCFASYDGTFSFQLEFETQEATYLGGDIFFGMYCLYTSTRTDKFFFDDISIQPNIPDTTPPLLISASPVSANLVDVVFDEALDQNSIIPSNFSLNNGIGTPLSAELDFNNNSLVHLELDNLLQNQTDYSLTTNNIADELGNTSASQNTNFQFLQPETADRFDILITEIMADPTPQIALPNAEFVELYNRSDKTLNLENFGFDSGSSPKALPSHVLLPENYVVLCDVEDIADFQQFGETIGINGFPALVNSGDKLTLSDPEGNIVHSVTYASDWYRDVTKEEGGWTLELISPFNICEEKENWQASQNLAGGTPGQQNSVFDNFEDQKSPDLIRAFVDANKADEIKLFFTENLDKDNAENIDNYAISNNIEITSATLQSFDNKVVVLKLNSFLELKTVYEITLSTGLTDCMGNAVGVFNTARVGVPEAFEAQDVLVNEILFNPEVGGVDFVEIYNQTSKIFNLNDLTIGNLHSGVDTVLTTVNQDFLLFPMQYVVLTELASDIQNQYFVQHPENLLENDLPAFDNESGNISLIYSEGTANIVVDAFDYDEDYHHALLDDVNGVSLERIDPNGDSQSSSNWHSAAKSVGFATPTYQNSQFLSNELVSEDLFWLAQKTFSPDNDGFEDFLQINYEMEIPGYIANIKIFDAAGRFVKDLSTNELLATEGFIKWDGTTHERRKARVGIYIIWIQIFSPDGDVKEFKKTCALAK